jgi:hypothetical protein
MVAPAIVPRNIVVLQVGNAALQAVELIVQTLSLSAIQVPIGARPILCTRHVRQLPPQAVRFIMRQGSRAYALLNSPLCYLDTLTDGRRHGR